MRKVNVAVVLAVQIVIRLLPPLSVRLDRPTSIGPRFLHRLTVRTNIRQLQQQQHETLTRLLMLMRYYCFCCPGYDFHFHLPHSRKPRGYVFRQADQLDSIKRFITCASCTSSSTATLVHHRPRLSASGTLMDPGHSNE